MPLYRRSRSQVWWCRFKIRGQEVRRSTDTANRREAEAFERKLRTALEQELPLIQPGRTLEDVRVLDIDDRRARKVDPTVIKRMYDIHWAHLRRFFGNPHPKDISPAMIRAYSTFVRERNHHWNVTELHRNHAFWRKQAKVSEPIKPVDPDSEAELERRFGDLALSKISQMA